jgi:pyridoxine kinase
VTSLGVAGIPADAIEILASDRTGRFCVRTPRLPLAAHGAGDALAALFLAHYLRSGSATTALSRAASSIFGLVRRTAEAGASELLLVEAQDEFVTPSRVFEAQPV